MKVLHLTVWKKKHFTNNLEASRLSFMYNCVYVNVGHMLQIVLKLFTTKSQWTLLLID